MRFIELRTGRNPFELAVLLVAALTGVTGGLFPDARSPGVKETFPDPRLVVAWYTVVAVGALLGLYGVWRRDVESGFLLERLGLAALGLACPAYGIAALSNGGWPAFTAAAGVGLSYGGACWWRVAQISRDLPGVRVEQAALRQAQEADPEDGDRA